MNKINTKNLLQWIREVNAPEYFAGTNIKSVGWGPKIKDGKETGEYSLIFYVNEKLPLESLNSTVLLPNTFQYENIEVSTDVQEIIIHSFANTDCNIISDTVEPVKSNRIRRRHLRSGCEAIAGQFAWGNYTGTLGTFVIDKSDGQIVALSNNHVFAESQISSKLYTTNPTNTQNLSAYQPSGYYKTTKENDYIGKCKRPVVIGNINAASNSVITSCDAAIVELKDKNLLGTSSSSSSLKPLGFIGVHPFPFATDEEIDSLLNPSSANFGAPLFRSGRTCGPIGSPGTTTTCSLSVYQFSSADVGSYNGYTSTFTNSFFFRGTSIAGRPGDSGSMMLALFNRGTMTEQWKIIGLLFAGPSYSPSYSIGCRITSIARDLGVVPWDGSTIPTTPSKTTILELTTEQSNNFTATVSLSGRTFYQIGKAQNK